MLLLVLTSALCSVCLLLLELFSTVAPGDSGVSDRRVNVYVVRLAFAIDWPLVVYLVSVPMPSLAQRESMKESACLAPHLAKRRNTLWQRASPRTPDPIVALGHPRRVFACVLRGEGCSSGDAREGHPLSRAPLFPASSRRLHFSDLLA